MGWWQRQKMVTQNRRDVRKALQLNVAPMPLYVTHSQIRGYYEEIKQIGEMPKRMRIQKQERLFWLYSVCGQFEEGNIQVVPDISPGVAPTPQSTPQHTQPLPALATSRTVAFTNSSFNSINVHPSDALLYIDGDKVCCGMCRTAVFIGSDLVISGYTFLRDDTKVVWTDQFQNIVHTCDATPQPPAEYIIEEEWIGG